MGLFTKNYSKPGKGVEKNEQQKRPFFLFFELFFAKFWKMIQLNLLYLLFWIPAIAASAFMTNISPTLAYLLFFLIAAFTAGPATSAAVYVLRCFTTRTPVFLFSDFLQQFKQNYKQSVGAFLFNAVALFACYASYTVYAQLLPGGVLSILARAAIVLMAIVLAFETFHVFLMIVTVDLKLRDIIKNCLLFVFLNLIRNVCTLIFAVGFLWMEYKLYPLSVMILPFVGLVIPLFIMTFNAYPAVKRYAIDPYYEANGRPEEEEAIFEDVH